MRSLMVTVSWSPPLDRNSRLIEYRVIILPAAELQPDVSRWKAVSNSILSDHVSGLLPNTSYRAWVVAINGRSRELISEFATSTFTTKSGRYIGLVYRRYVF